MTALAPLVFLLGFGLFVNLGLLVLCAGEERKIRRRARRERIVAHELNSRRWHFANKIGATGGNRSVPSAERWSA